MHPYYTWLSTDGLTAWSPFCVIWLDTWALSVGLIVSSDTFVVEIRGAWKMDKFFCEISTVKLLYSDIHGTAANVHHTTEKLALSHYWEVVMHFLIKTNLISWAVMIGIKDGVIVFVRLIFDNRFGAGY